MLGIGDMVITTLVTLMVGSKLPYIEEQYQGIVAFLWMLVVFLVASLEQFGGI